ncbi:hypothetical protein HY383_02300 [Candidatus Daviesbacteria bacterium]|nr:hypothetical protein [Candidatus Daviesbacteria bacterium]
MYKRYLIVLVILLGLFLFWSYQGIVNTGIHVDLARDLNFLSDIWIHKIVWLGPMTSANFPASPIYYYLLFPGLLLSGGNALSLIVSQAFFALLGLGLFAYFQIKRSLISALLVILAIGLSPWWIKASSAPWNGYMYVSWIFLGLTSLWFKGPIFVSALLFGIAIAINPVAILGLPVLFYEWIANTQKVRKLFYILLGLLLPWTPIIIFEVITKAFLTRQWLEHPSTAGIVFDPNLSNISPLLNSFNLSSIVAIIILFTSFFIGSKRAKFWIIFASLPIIFVFSVTPLRQYYLFGLMSALTFTIVTTLSSHMLGKIILTLFILSYLQVITLPPLVLAGRSIIRMDNMVSTFIQKSNLDKTKKYAVVSLRDLQNSTPQADDFRFFLRIKGVNALSIDDYPKADILLLFIEVPNFKWQNWDDWHIQRFGSRKFISNQNIDGIEVIMYSRD